LLLGTKDRVLDENSLGSTFQFLGVCYVGTAHPGRARPNRQNGRAKYPTKLISNI